MEIKKLNSIIKLWGMDYKKSRQDILIPGSPERTLFRIVVQDAENKLWMLEQIAQNLLERKNRIAHNLNQLKKQNPSLTLRPYMMNTSQSFTSFFQGSYWMLSPYLYAESLIRPDYLKEEWRGKALAQFMIDLRATVLQTKTLDTSTDLPGLDSYALTLAQQISQHNPKVYTAIEPIMNYLNDNLFPCLKKLPHFFCHGDFHPENVLWGQHEMLSVIDWEFSGPRPELYDLANLIGCMGMEHPSAFEKPMMKTLASGLRQSHFGDAISWSKLKELIICLRLGWMSEWLRKKDQEMVELEIEFMHLLLNELILE